MNTARQPARPAQPLRTVAGVAAAACLWLGAAGCVTAPPSTGEALQESQCAVQKDTLSETYCEGSEHLYSCAAAMDTSDSEGCTPTPLGNSYCCPANACQRAEQAWDILMSNAFIVAKLPFASEGTCVDDDADAASCFNTCVAKGGIHAAQPCHSSCFAHR